MDRYVYVGTNLVPALFVLLSFTASGCPFGISKLFLSAFSRYTIIFPYGYQIKITIKIHTGTPGMSSDAPEG
jgi:hypothetical protein